MATESSSKFTVYSYPASQWAGVPHLTLAEKGFEKSEYEIKDIDLIAGDNFDPEYLSINPNGTIPSLTSSSLSSPLTESKDILEYLNSLRPSGTQLVPEDPAVKARVDKLVEFAHSSQVNTNLLLLQARGKAEFDAKKETFWKVFVSNRQAKLEKYKSELPENSFYGPKSAENGFLYKLYTTDVGPEHEKFFEVTEKQYVDFAAGLDKLNELLVLPYAAGDEVTAADFHLVPWLSHALWGAGATAVHDFAALEKLIGVSVPGFKVGDRVKSWWTKISERPAFKAVYPELH